MPPLPSVATALTTAAPSITTALKPAASLLSNPHQVGSQRQLTAALRGLHVGVGVAAG